MVRTRVFDVLFKETYKFHLIICYGSMMKFADHDVLFINNVMLNHCYAPHFFYNDT